TIEGNGIATSTYYIHTDHLGGSNVITDENGDVVQLLDYYPYGGIRLDEKNGLFDEKKKFTGHEYDAETGLNYMNARYQDGNIGQFLSIDPMFFDVGKDKAIFKQQYDKDMAALLSNPQELNSYSYVVNNPINKKDLTGKAFVVDDAIGFLGGGLVGAVVQGVSSIINGQTPQLAELSGSFVTGGIIGWGAINSPETLGASNAISAAIITGLLGGFYGDLTKQGINIATGKQEGGINSNELSSNTLITAGAGGLTQGVLPNAKVPGLSSGRGNMNAIGESMRTKTVNGTIKSMSINSATKSAVGSQAANLYRTIVNGAVDIARSIYNKIKEK
ncbi:MAG: RHS repeat-associated core domain-containing protein, partial [Patescibacteria group bacterium]